MVSRNLVLQKAVKVALDGLAYKDSFTKGQNTFELLASPVRDGEEVRGVILFILDITSQQKVEILRREFSANVSHELKSPLTSILGYAELMFTGMVQPEDQAAFIDRIYNEARHLLRLVEDTINLSRLDEKDVQLPVEEIDLFALAQEVADRLAPWPSRKRSGFPCVGKSRSLPGSDRSWRKCFITFATMQLNIIKKTAQSRWGLARPQNR